MKWREHLHQRGAVWTQRWVGNRRKCKKNEEFTINGRDESSQETRVTAAFRPKIRSRTCSFACTSASSSFQRWLYTFMENHLKSNWLQFKSLYEKGKYRRPILYQIIQNTLNRHLESLSVDTSFRCSLLLLLCRHSFPRHSDPPVHTLGTLGLASQSVGWSGLRWAAAANGDVAVTWNSPALGSPWDDIMHAL